jgi:hypothetical protein
MTPTMIPTWLLSPAAATAIGVVAFIFVKPKHPKVALWFFIGAGIYVLHALLRETAHIHGLNTQFVSPLVLPLSIAFVVYGIFELIDAQHPTRGITLPAVVQEYRSVDMFMHVPEIFAGFFPVAFAALEVARGNLYSVVTILAVGVVLVGSAMVRRRNSVLCFVLERVPENVVWVYVQQVLVVNRGTRHWSVCVGLSTGGFIVQPTKGEAAAKELLTGVASVCPAATFGYDGTKAAQFRQNPASMRQLTP